MLAIHDRLQTTCIGLGLVRLLQDAKRFEEAKATLCLLEGAESVKRSKKPAKRITRSRSSATVRIEAA